MRVVGLNLHPVKSTAIRPVESALVGPAGLRGDREWMVVDESGEMVSARGIPHFFHVVADTPATGDVDADLVLRAPYDPDLPDLVVRRPDTDEASARLFGSTRVRVHPAAPETSAWLAEALGRDDLRLVWCPGDARRETDHDAWAPDGPTAFQDTSPVTLVTTATVRRIGEWMRDEAQRRGEPDPGSLDVRRLRPNIVVDGADEAFVEDGWGRVRVGEAVLRVEGPVERCAMAAIDPDSLARGREPIRTLARHRRGPRGVLAAVHLVTEEPGPVRVGDPVTLLD